MRFLDALSKIAARVSDPDLEVRRPRERLVIEYLDTEREQTIIVGATVVPAWQQVERSAEAGAGQYPAR